MTTLLDRRAVRRAPAPHRRRRCVWILAGLVTLLIAAVVAAVAVQRVRTADLHRDYLGRDGWPVTGQAAYSLGGTIHASPHETPVPIASVAKVMTAYLVLRTMPLRDGAAGPAIRVTSADVRDYVRRRDDGQSVLRVRVGERLTERQALIALLLPSANNVAIMLARRVAGSVREFVARMNAAAGALGMARTRYTDPSGFAAGTVSTARDQLVLADSLGRESVIDDLVALPTSRLPVVGVVRNTDVLLGTDGFVGTKTGSDDAAGGCFMFRVWRVVHRQLVDVRGMVLGQRGRHDLTAGLVAAQELAARIGAAARA